MQKYKTKIIQILKNNINNYKDYTVFLFGSRAQKTNRVNSDYDIWLLWKNKNIKLDYMILLKIKRELNELPIAVDIVDFNSIDDVVFKTLALKKTVKWN